MHNGLGYRLSEAHETGSEPSEMQAKVAKEIKDSVSRTSKYLEGAALKSYESSVIS